MISRGFHGPPYPRPPFSPAFISVRHGPTAAAIACNRTRWMLFSHTQRVFLLRSNNADVRTRRSTFDNDLSCGEKQSAVFLRF